MLYLLWGCLILTVLVVGESPVYGQKIQELQSESAYFGNGPIVEPKPALDLVRVGQLIFARTNQFRDQEKRTPLKSNYQLTESAQAFADYLAKTDKFCHTADGKEPWDRTTKAGYQHCIILENIAYEYNSAGFTVQALANDLVRGWENSPGHRKNMLDPDVLEIGVGLARSSNTGRYYAVQDFGRPKSAMITFKVFNRTDAMLTYTIDDQTCTAGPNYTITYERSRPPELRFVWGEKANVTQAARRLFRPANGASYTVRTTEEKTVTVDGQ
ncbi:CAP domain-containing protein [Telmatocola sphagniphila]|uniref:CAP domain-containing protein n=1 Tax=Telmatocola sphagniphila TaxID=1123043 RepID=A0A8E6B251_9BACT|nr:CAP domain-containing protein [Telmatocola sphagniphila]QVL29999.1 CAP domain-containing protein [Telmatocola sphagniphila]